MDRFLLAIRAMPAPFPHVYNATVRRTFASRARVDAPPRPSLDAGPSLQLDGDSAAWSPEHLVLSSPGICMLRTFEALAGRDGIELLSWDAHARGEVDRTPEGLAFTSIVLVIDMEVTGKVERIA